MDNSPHHLRGQEYQKPQTPESMPNPWLRLARRVAGVGLSAVLAVVPSSSVESSAKPIFPEASSTQVDIAQPSNDYFEHDPTDLVSSQQEAEQRELKITTWNTMYNNLKNVGIEAKRVMKEGDSDVLILQELHGELQRDNVQKALCKMIEKYGCYMAPYKNKKKADRGGSSESSYPVIWRKDSFELVGEGHFQKMTGSYINSDGDEISARYAVTVLLRNKKTGEKLYVVNTHMPSDVDDNGKVHKHSEAAAHYKGHTQNLAKLLAKLVTTGKTVVIGGDFNVARKTDTGKVSMFPEAFFEKNGFTDTRDGAVTKGPNYTLTGENGEKVLIDYIFTNGDLVSSEQVISKKRHGSDHFPLTSTVRSTVAWEQLHPRDQAMMLLKKYPKSDTTDGQQPPQSRLKLVGGSNQDGKFLDVVKVVAPRPVPPNEGRVDDLVARAKELELKDQPDDDDDNYRPQRAA